MISMTSHPISKMYVREVMPTWKGYNVTQFEAVTPKDLVYKNKLDFKTKTTGKKREFTSTEKAVWYSHFELWCECINKGPLIVVEHDAKLLKPLPDMKDEGYKFLAFMNRDYGRKGKFITPGVAYYITPPIAERLVAQAVSKPITQNSDGHLSVVMNWNRQVKMNDYYYVEQINFDGLNTIDHKNVNRKFIGPDYENFDIPSLHRQA